MKKTKYKKQEREPRSTDCSFCKSGMIPSYKKYEELRGFMSERGRILNKGYTGVCSRHQRILTSEVKKARHLALLPFASGQ